ncbi:transmembrane channel-like protein 5 isoform X6 [Gopherus evgoodei]|uniref:transmembrane channel-like protein 5 isoform X6 n=1 Tax=Gopherus evgoodei TaxID=1825980 RepID=UPI0011CF352D|nr:transmembrane channel-like protein 5 isoform X6 [Gopherus evgoodei]
MKPLKTQTIAIQRHWRLTEAEKGIHPFSKTIMIPPWMMTPCTIPMKVEEDKETRIIPWPQCSLASDTVTAHRGPTQIHMEIHILILHLSMSQNSHTHLPLPFMPGMVLTYAELLICLMEGEIAEDPHSEHLLADTLDFPGLLTPESLNAEGERSSELPESSSQVAASDQKMVFVNFSHSSASIEEGSFSQSYNRRQADLVYRMPSSLLRLDSNAETYDKDKYKHEEKLIKNLASISSKERVKAIQKTPKTMKEKRDIRNKVLMEKTKKSVSSSTQINCCTQCLYKTALSYQRFKNGMSEYLHLLQLWQKTLKVIGGKFGTSVLSYFVFLKWLLTFNIFSFLVNFSFITIPQLIASGPNNLSFNGLELLTGAGYFKKTVLYYGFYTNSTITKTENNSSYDMQLAYIFTIGIYFIICFFSLVYSMAKSFRKNFINPQTYSGSAAKLLCIWDFNITNEKAVKLKQSNLSTQIKESLSEVTLEVLNLSPKQRIARIAVHLLVWMASLGIAAACCAGVYFFSRNNLQLLEGNKSELENEAATLVLPIVVSLLNLLIPFCFALFGLIEKFQYPRHQLYATVIRNVFLKIAIIGILCYYWLNDVATSEKECWESLVGQDIYRLIVIDFIFCLLASFFGEFVRRIIGTKCCKKLGVPEFDIARNVLDLIYTQTLAWRTPSKQCGPFQGLTSIIDAVSGWMHILDSYSSSKWVVWIYYNLIGSVHFFFILTVIVLIITYLYWQIIEGRRIMVRLLHEQIINEGKDKMFLLNKLRALQTSKLDPPKEQQERSSSSYQPYRRAALQMTASIERPFGRNGRDFYVEPSSARIPEKTSLPPADTEGCQPGISETLALALRARQQAEWEMEDNDDEDFRP